MEKIVSETNSKLNSIINALNNVKVEYEKKLESNQKNIDDQLGRVKNFKDEYIGTKERIEQSKKDIRSFEEDYQSLVNRFKDDELSSILVAANKEITTKIEERKKKILKDKTVMNTLLAKANKVKSNLVILTSEKKSLEMQYKNISDAYEFYNTSLTEIIEFAENNNENLLSYFKKDFVFDSEIDTEEDIDNEINEEEVETEEDDVETKEEIVEEDLSNHIFDDFEDTLFENIYDEDEFMDVEIEDSEIEEEAIDDEDINIDDIDIDDLDLDDILLEDLEEDNEDEIILDDIIIDEEDNNINLDDILLEEENEIESDSENDENEINLDDIINIDDIEDDDELFN